MRFGLHLNSDTTSDKSIQEKSNELVEQTEVANDAGFDLVGMGQHYLVKNPKLQLMPTLGRIASVAGSMKLFSGIFILPFHHPIQIAEQTTTLDGLCGGLEFGVGAGYRDVTFQNFGVSKSERAGRMTEGIELLNRLWTEESVTYDGEFYSVEDATINPRPSEKPPIWYGGASKPAVDRAARMCEKWYPDPIQPLPRLREFKEVYDDRRDELGKDTSIPIIRETFVAPTTEEAVATAGEALRDKYAGYIKRNFDETGDTGLDEESSGEFESLAADRFLVGSPEDVCAELERYNRELDVETINMRVQWPGLAHEDACRCLRLIGDEVIPNL